ncbi:hypothetical protein BG015_011856 [Linnemannia schmuckeri]|uniref:HCP-like protein n=1 Tax=Linnemannia schmuckeri TaxID=64567 RepID=A0A9P5S4Q7_9FUNG|nr:hypothetical protein BG015_011856 [Linnemannia schmuckeri]
MECPKEEVSHVNTLVEDPITQNELVSSNDITLSTVEDKLNIGDEVRAMIPFSKEPDHKTTAVLSSAMNIVEDGCRLVAIEEDLCRIMPKEEAESADKNDEDSICVSSGATADQNQCDNLDETEINVASPRTTAEELIQMINNTKLGDKDAQVALGDLCKSGRRIEQNYQAVMHWYLRSVDQGDPVGQRKVAHLYGHGHGVSQNYRTTVHLCFKATEKGCADAQCTIGYSYEKGNGLPQDISQAMEWYIKAANQSDPFAQCDIGYL